MWVDVDHISNLVVRALKVCRVLFRVFHMKCPPFGCCSRSFVLFLSYNWDPTGEAVRVHALHSCTSAAPLSSPPSSGVSLIETLFPLEQEGGHRAIYSRAYNTSNFSLILTVQLITSPLVSWFSSWIYSGKNNKTSFLFFLHFLPHSAQVSHFNYSKETGSDIF